MAARAISEIVPELMRYYEAFFREGGLSILAHIDIASNLVDCFENSGRVLGNVGKYGAQSWDQQRPFQQLSHWESLLRLLLLPCLIIL